MPLVGALVCVVVAVADGDTLTTRCTSAEAAYTQTVRLSEIDAPEKRQPWGERSKQSLAELCFKKPATVREEGKDRYGRTVARVHCDGVDANAAQVQRGMAWVFDRYATDRSLYALQQEARESKRGLWADPEPVPPWEWRKQRAGL